MYTISYTTNLHQDILIRYVENIKCYVTHVKALVLYQIECITKVFDLIVFRNGTIVK